MSENIKIKCNDGETFTLAGIEFIKFPSKDGKTPVVAKNTIFKSRFGENNDLQESPILKRLQSEFLPKIIEVLGEENVCTFKTDLTTLDGLRPYPDLESKVSLVTLDFYREHAEIFDKYKPDIWWWLAAPESAMPNSKPWYILCVSPSGYVNNFDYNFDSGGVRPFCIYKSSIFES